MSTSFFNNHNENNGISPLETKIATAMNKEFPKAQPIQDKPFAVQMLKYFPILAGLSDNIGGSGKAIIKIATLKEGAQALGHGAQSFSQASALIGFAMSAFDFLRIPFIYLISWIAGKPAPIKLSTTARWVYSGVILGLAIASFAVPGAALTLGVVASALAFVASTWILGRVLFLQHQYRKDLALLDAQVQAEETAFKQLQTELQELTENAKAPGAHTKNVNAQIKILLGAIEKTEALAQDLVNQQAIVKRKLEKKDSQKIMSKVQGLFLATLAVTGTVLTLLLPITGLTILAAGALIGGGIIVTKKIVIALIRFFINKAKPEQKIAATLAETQAEHTDTIRQSKTTADETVAKKSPKIQGKQSVSHTPKCSVEQNSIFHHKDMDSSKDKKTTEEPKQRP